MLKKIRLTLELIFFVGITLLFLDFSGTVQPLLGWMAKLQFLPNVMRLNWGVLLILLALTLLFGRIYCSVICPLGAFQDVFARIGKWKLFRRNKKAKFANNYSYSKPKTWLRLTVLLLFIVMLVAGFNAGAVLLAPYSAYGRMVASLLQPVYIYINNVLAAWSESNDNFWFYQVESHNNPALLLAVSGVTAVVLMVLAFMNGRIYCNTICPVGTVLGYLSRFSWMKIQIDEDKCIKCGLCAKNCKAACINIQKGTPATIDATRCVACGDCEGVCNKQAIRYAPVTKFAKKTEPAEKADDLSRRSFLSVVGTATVATALQAQEKTTDGGLAVIEDKQIPERKTPLTPAGSLSARNLQQHCTACQLCIANCPNGVLRPSTSMEHFMQPEMEYEKGYCRPECTRCADVCPAGAIRPITKEEKTSIQIGHAVWIQKNCVPAEEGIPCGNCARHCPSGAIQMVPLDKELKQNEEGLWVDEYGTVLNQERIIMMPAVNTEKCIGCGACEYVCPARPFSAIYVEGHEVHREI
ncbi:MAG: 4Fe-4S dicluster domain-containing protein [Bacteroidaceae bacterium]|nr:4Fe-4S dicluster domain-containing protein [Bacteroidaceae bacterium]